MAQTEQNQEFTPLPDEEKAKKKDKRKKRRKNRNVLSIYRTASRNHVAFVAIGDRRANILIGTCTLIISVSFTILLRGALRPTVFLVPGIILIITCTATMILAMVSTRPYNARNFYTLAQKRSKTYSKPPNLLFFEHFYKMNIQEYEAAMDKMVESNLNLRHAMVHDLHGLGVSVARKYKYLRISYDVLMVGVILTVLAMFVALIRQYQGEV